MRCNRHPVPCPKPSPRPAHPVADGPIPGDPSPSSAFVRAVLGLLALLVVSPGTPGQAQPPTPAPTPALSLDVLQPNPGVLRSVFVSDPSFGKDPFFPESKRRFKDLPIVPSAVTNNWSPTPVPSDVGFDRFTLKGISRSGERKLAMINYYTFAEGEEQEVKVDNQTITVKCELIKERSVIIRINDRTKEITLRDGVY